MPLGYLLVHFTLANITLDADEEAPMIDAVGTVSGACCIPQQLHYDCVAGLNPLVQSEDRLRSMGIKGENLFQCRVAN